MDMFVNRLYRTRLQFGYEPQNSQTRQGANSNKSQYAYGSSDLAEISPLGIVLYASAQNADGGFEDVSEQFQKSPFAQQTEDYSVQAKKISAQHSTSEQSQQQVPYQDITPQKQKSFVDALELTAQQMSSLLQFGQMAKQAYSQFNFSTVMAPEQTISLLA